MGKHEPYFCVDMHSGVVGQIMSRLTEITDTFDTIVVTGTSGQFYGPVLAYIMQKEYCVVRKPNDGSHDYHKIVGNVGSRWIFFDDFVSTGNTRKRVKVMMRECEPSSTYVGTFEYDEMKWTPASKEIPSRCSCPLCSEEV